ncbi:hypothetical protein BRD00_03385 [Halobacteriales archaeon QS_8_69_26]|nr:MAG: hypothetical protein BRD00_03385 [Halobacteriales archaeon QS_8_69_26]
MVDHWERWGIQVVQLKPREVGAVSAGELVVDVQLRFPLLLHGEVSSGMDDGTLTLEASSEVSLRPEDCSDSDTTMTVDELVVNDDGTVSVWLVTRVPVGSEEPAGAAVSSYADVSADGGASVEVGGTASDPPASPPGPVVGEHDEENGSDDPAATVDDPTDATVHNPTDATVGDPTDATVHDPTDATVHDPDEGSDGTDFDRDPDVPPFEDETYLQQVYDAYDTFDGMAEELDVAVTSETVRRYMIDAGVHEPASYDTDGTGEEAADDEVDAGDPDDDEARDDNEARANEEPDDDEARVDEEPDADEDRADDEPDAGGAGVDDADGSAGPDRESEGTADPAAGGSPPDQGFDGTDPVEEIALTDGIGLPDGVPLDELVAAVEDARTMYDVQRRLGIDRPEARETLRDLGLLNLVVGRLATEEERNVSRQGIVERIWQHTRE